MTSLGLEVEEIIDPIAPIANLIVAKVETCVEHPDSDLRWIKHYGFVPLDVPTTTAGLSLTGGNKL